MPMPPITMRSLAGGSVGIAESGRGDDVRRGNRGAGRLQKLAASWAVAVAHKSIPFVWARKVKRRPRD